MSDVVGQARTARERLASGLAALQAPDVPARLMDVAAPVAQAMAVLHNIETTRGAALGRAPEAVRFLRTALAELQAQPPQVPAVAQAVASVAGSLSVVHDLAALAAQAPQPAAARPAAPAAAAPAAAARPAAPVAVAPIAAPAQPQRLAPAPGGAYHPAQPPPQFVPIADERPSSSFPPAAPGEPWRVEAALGAHSASNFYKGLSANDIIVGGGIFVATYQAPPIGSEVLLKIAMPGGYEFEARGFVQWTRATSLSQPSGGVHAPPGFGARFSMISEEGRQLVHRYVRNREPLFYDDL